MRFVWMMWHDHWLPEPLTDLEDLWEIRFELHSCNSGIKTVVLSFALINLEAKEYVFLNS